ncbi:MAG: leucine-rich repeat protein [Ruminococcus sp.]|nr:leucine-rich repeat protein [Ruminococcus sp.]
MFKKLLKAVTACVVMAGAAALMSLTASAYSFYGSQNSDGTMTVSGFNLDYNWETGESEKLPSTLTLPEKLEGKKVTKVDSYFLSFTEGVNKVVIPEGYTAILDNAFCVSDITEVVLPSTLKTIGSYAFNECEKLASINLGRNLTSIGKYAFSNCLALRSVELGKFIKTIGNYAFYCSALETVAVPNNVTSLGTGAFEYCVQLESAYIGSGVKTLPQDCFYGCSKLTDVYAGSVKTISDQAFYSCESLRSVTIPATVTDISYSAFWWLPDDFTVSAPTGSYAQSFCEEYGIPFKAVKLTNLSNCTKSVTVADASCTGLEITPAITIKNGSYTLKEGTDYTVSVTHSKTAGIANVTIYGKGKYTGTYSKTFTVKPLDLTSSDLKVTIPYASYTYRGRGIKPTVTVKYKGVKVDPSVYTVKLANNVKPGTADITVTAKGNNSKGSYTRHFKVTKLDIANDANVKVTIPCASYMYRGRPIKPTVTVKYGSDVIPTSDYTVTLTNNTEIGTAYITVKAKSSNITGTRKRTFKVTQLDLSQCKITIPYASYSCTGSAITPAATVKLGSAVIPEANYTLRYGNNKNVGIASITITAKGTKATGKLTRSFTIKPGKTTAVKIANYNNKITLNWTKAIQADGYEIWKAYIDTQDAKISGIAAELYKTISSGTTTGTSFTVSDDDLFYGYGVRAYKIVNGTKYYGNYAFFHRGSSVVARINGLTPSKSRTSYNEVNVQGSKDAVYPHTLTAASKKAIEDFAKKYFTSGMTNGEKVLVTLNYIRKNFTYNTGWKIKSSQYISGSYAHNALVAHLGQCNDYNGAIAELLTYLGYEPKLLIGYVYRPTTQHYWTEITIGKNTYLIEGGISKDENGKTIVNFACDCALYSEYPVYYKYGKIAE